MTPLEIYKLLPRTNCGECPPKSCMAFALAVKSDPGLIVLCRRIAPASLEKIKAQLIKENWQDELIKNLSVEIASLNFKETAHGLGARLSDGKLLIRCIGTDYALENNGTITPDTGNKWINILLLHYVRSRGSGEFTGKWISFSEFRGGLVKASSFRRECEEPLREIFDADPDSAVKTLERLGAIQADGHTADYGLVMELLPKVRALLLYRKADEEFPSSLNILFDSITGRFLDVESIMFLCEGLLHTMTMRLRHPG